MKLYANLGGDSGIVASVVVKPTMPTMGQTNPHPNSVQYVSTASELRCLYQV